MNEFEIIGKYFWPLAQGRDRFLDDAAVLSVPEGHELIVTSDSSNAGTHFMADAAAGDIAHKVLRRNLSDLAAMGATPLCYQLNIAFPAPPEPAWLEEFTEALLQDQKKFKIYCSGGDTTSIKGPLSISITALGLVPIGKALRREKARPGDHILLTGPVGDALIGLRVLQKKIKTDNDRYFINAYYKPAPRFGVSNGYATAAIDISDGLVADLGHMCEASGCGATISITPGIFSREALKTGVPAADLLTGGDDYELLLAVPADKAAKLQHMLFDGGLSCVRIGQFTEESGVRVYDENNALLPLEKTGWTHF